MLYGLTEHRDLGRDSSLFSQSLRACLTFMGRPITAPLLPLLSFILDSETRKENKLAKNSEV